MVQYGPESRVLSSMQIRSTNLSAKLPGCLILLGLLCCFTNSATATTLVATGFDTARTTDVWIWANGTEEIIGTGPMNIIVDGIWNRVAFCADLFTDIYFGNNNTSNLVGVNTITNGGRAAWLIDNYLPTGLESNAKTLGAAMQFAIWDILHDGGDGFGAGLVRSAISNITDAAVLAAAQNFETLSLGQTTSRGVIYTNVDIGLGLPAQMLIGPLVPEPSSYLLVACGIIAGFAKRRLQPSRKA